jgi:hypothetical protein
MSDSVQGIVPGSALKPPLAPFADSAQGELQTVIGIDDLLGVETSNADDAYGMVFDWRYFLDLAVDQLNVYTAATGTYAANAGTSRKVM